MAGLTSKGAALFLDHLTKVSPYSLPTLYAVLTSTTPTATAAGTEMTTSIYGGYARKALVGANWGGASSGASVYNGTEIDFGAASSGSGGNLMGLELWDASSGGNRIWWEGVTSIAITTGRHIKWLTGVLTATINQFGTPTANSGFSNAVVNSICDHLTGKTSYTAPTALYIALGTANATATAIGTEGTVYTGYTTRPALSAAAATVASPSIVYPSAQINFQASTGTATVVSFSAIDNATPGSGTYIGGSTLTGGSVVSGVTPDMTTAQPIFSLQ